MAHHKALMKSGFLLPTCEKHFHDPRRDLADP